MQKILLREGEKTQRHNSKQLTQAFLYCCGELTHSSCSEASVTLGFPPRPGGSPRTSVRKHLTWGQALPRHLT